MKSETTTSETTNRQHQQTGKFGSGGFRCASFRSGSLTAWQAHPQSPLRLASNVTVHCKKTAHTNHLQVTIKWTMNLILIRMLIIQ